MAECLTATEGNHDCPLLEAVDLLKPLEKQWYELGIQLRIEKVDLDRIEADHIVKGVNRCLTEIIQFWKKNEDPSWGKLADAVRNVGGHKDVERKIHTRLYSSNSSDESGYGSLSPSGQDSDEDMFSTSSLSPGCGCGECNIHKMCTEGCPRPNYTKRLPILTKYAGGKTASEIASERLATPNGANHDSLTETTFEQETVDLRAHFAKLVLKISTSLREQHTDKDDVTLYLGNTFPMLEKIADKMEKATNMPQLLSVVTRQGCSWFNFTIIKKLIEDFGRKDDSECLVKYEQHFLKFAKHRLPQGMTHVELGSKTGMSGCKKLVIKIDREWESISIGELDRLCREFATILRIDRKNLYLADVNEGCFMLTLMIPEEIADSISKSSLTSDQKQMLANDKIIRLTCGEMKWSTSNSTEQCFDSKEAKNNHQATRLKSKALSKKSTTRSRTSSINKLHRLLSFTAGRRQHQESTIVSSPTTIAENVFLFGLSQRITKAQSRALVKIEELPARLEDQSPFDVLMQLKMQGRYSKLGELAAILKDIHRNDLAKEVMSYAKECKKKTKPKTQKESAQPPPAVTSDANHLECVVQLQLAKLQNSIFMDQTRKLEEVAHEARYSRVEEMVRKDLKELSEEMNKKLQYISTLVETGSTWPCSSQAKARPRSSSSDSQSSSSSISSSQSLEESQTLLHLSSDDMYSTFPELYCGNNSGITETSQSVTNARRVTRESPQPNNKGTTSRERSIQVLSTKMREDADIPKLDQTDSGFAEAGEFLKEEPEIVKGSVNPLPPKTEGYMSLERSTMEDVGYYITSHNKKTTNCDPRDARAHGHSNEPIYTNESAIATNQLEGMTLKRKPQ